MVICIYSLVDQFPKKEEFALSPQIRRAAISIPSNIAEGCGRSSNKELYHFLNIASGSIAALETQIYIACELGYIDDDDASEVYEKIENIQKLLTGFKKHIKKQIDDMNE